MDEQLGLSLKAIYEQYPEKPIEITEFGRANIANNDPISAEEIANEYVLYYQDLFKYPYVRSAIAILMSSPDQFGGSFSWRTEGGRFQPVVGRVRDMPRPPLVSPSLGSPDEQTDLSGVGDGCDCSHLVRS